MKFYVQNLIFEYKDKIFFNNFLLCKEDIWVKMYVNRKCPKN